MSNDLHQPPNHLVILGHPRSGSFNHSVAERYCEVVRECGHAATLRDLYALEFEPRLGQVGADEAVLKDESSLLAKCDVLVFVYPMWFGMPPAIIKGYVDRVLGADFRPAQLMRNEPVPALVGKHFLSLSSSASTRPWLEEKGQWVSLRQAFDAYLCDVFAFGSDEHVHFESVVEGMSSRVAEEHLETVSQTARKTCAAIAHEHHHAAAQAALARYRRRIGLTL